MTNNEIIDSILERIKNGCGVSLDKDDYFSGIKKHKGKKHFNAILKDNRCSESLDYSKLVSYSYLGFSCFSRIECSGLNRVSIFLKE